MGTVSQAKTLSETEKNMQENTQVSHVLNVNKDGNKLFVYACKNYLRR